ncbi:2-succinyl-5-enolpyruvyl-6-hydroxy-3-cyclohexene-1-carboxylic-acid synthase [Halobacillus campisalis]|uniref:2-succinyl-5-enolpyruvyl-6-hydroxy-3-cyclohexene-1-carboxylate synthase n=1 Tax=Halobacillus campisalis TaxID=435909 RepID=A0ABW2K8L6_9BACI|nr:2-succinyl-5-enolpyruvyl-6-hydroxy-3-cyclohexene-1-carboxylic-acid synthase [Halobacillus campisalis]
MSHTEVLTKYMVHFVGQLASSGVEDVVISPGSRSTPLAMTFRQRDDINHWINLDERSAAFFALGIAKEKQKPVALVCTSGTAAANYYPAIVEAYYSRVPLLVLTADRPHELRDVGAPQAIEQTEMYGKYVKWFHDLALPEESLLSYVKKQAARAVMESTSEHNGPVHLNIPLREPLTPDFSLPELWSHEQEPIPEIMAGLTTLSKDNVKVFKELLLSDRNGLIVCGPQTNPDLAEAITELASKVGIPVLADPLSQLRAGDHDKRNVVESYDALLKSDPLKRKLQPDYIIRFGAMPVSKAYLQWIQSYGNTVEHFIVEEHSSYREPSGVAAQFVWCHPLSFCKQVSAEISEGSTEDNWLDLWRKMNIEAKEHMLAAPDERLNEGHAVAYLSDAIPDDSVLFVGNSMPIRDVDSFFVSTPKKVTIMANRGANGIDGVISTALGIAATGRKTTLLLGDVSFFHDLNGLLIAKQRSLNLTIVVINNDGGGIFSYLPQAEKSEHFEELFGTPLGIDFKGVTEMYGASHKRVTDWDTYKLSLSDSYKEEGLSIIEFLTNREDHVAFHKQKWNQIAEAVLSWEE